jgi:uncharacterized protein with NAD-binding domain and iron-sulfur cluster
LWKTENAMLQYSSSFVDAFGMQTSVRTSSSQRAKDSAALLFATATTDKQQQQQLKVVVIGGGWAGFSAADSLVQSSDSANSMNIDVLDASPRGPGGLAGGWKSASTNRTVEAGLHGFWREYRNTFATIQRILDQNDSPSPNTTTTTTLDRILTPYTPSVLYSANGRVALAPVLGNDDDNNNNSHGRTPANRQAKAAIPNLPDIWNVLTSSLLAPGGDTTTQQQQQQRSLQKALAKVLPPPLDVAILSEFSPDSPLSIADRLSAAKLLPVWADFNPQDEASWKRYDGISAETLFRAVSGISETLYTELVSPLLHVLPMCPGYDCSAAAALSCFHVFALQARGAFDVRWCRGTIANVIFNPWVQQLTARGVHIQGSAAVTAIAELDDHRFAVTVNDVQTIECDAIVFAVGITAAKRLLSSSPPLAAVKETAKWNQLRGVTCVCVRLFFRDRLPFAISDAMKDSPVAVCGARMGGIPELGETGFCIYDLQRLQDEFRNSTIAALEVDFFRADRILCTCVSDDNVAHLTLHAVSAALQIDPVDPALLVDVSVVRARNAVSHFDVGSASCTPASVKLRKGLYICGDWVDRTGHSSWSTEKSVVTGRQAAAAVAADYNIDLPLEATSIIPAAADTSQLAAVRKVAKLVRSLPGQSQGLPRTRWS